MSETDSKGYYVFYDLPKRTCTIEEAQSEGSITIDDVDRMYIYGDRIIDAYYLGPLARTRQSRTSSRRRCVAISKQVKSSSMRR